MRLKQALMALVALSLVILTNCANTPADPTASPLDRGDTTLTSAATGIEPTDSPVNDDDLTRHPPTLTPHPAPPGAPNILFILTDDMRLDELAYMPKLKRLLTDQGATFSNYFVNVPVCCPSRVTTLRGQYAHNTGVEQNGGANGGFYTAYTLGVEQSTIATWIQQNGYRTGLFGKYLNGYPSGAKLRYVPPGWSDWRSPISGFPDSGFNYTINENRELVQYGSQPEEYATDVYATLVDQFIRDSVTQGTPFFAYLAVHAPHIPAVPAPRHANLFPGIEAPRTPNFNERDVSDKPEYIASLPRVSVGSRERIDNLFRLRIQTLQAVDDAIEKLYGTLQATGQLDNTYIVFASDNGFHLGNHRMPAGKQTPYEEDIHVPLIVRGPGIAAGTVINQIAGNTDLAPTFAQMAQVVPPDFMDGRSLLPLLQGTPPTMWRQVFLIDTWRLIKMAPLPPSTDEAPSSTGEPLDSGTGVTLNEVAQSATLGDDEAAILAASQSASAVPMPKVIGDIPEYHGIRGRGFVYIEYEDGFKEFYDLLADPYELDNLAGQLDAASQQALSERVSRLTTCQGAACVGLEDLPLEITIPRAAA